jgi:trk system potassium uptake protein TrkA
MQAPPKILGKTVISLDLRSNFGLNIIAIENNGNVLEVIQPEYTFQKNDILFLSGSKTGLLKFNQYLKS